MQKLESRIVAHDVELDRHDVRVLQRQMDNWIQDHALLDASTPPEGELIVEYDGPHQYLCRAVVKAGNHEWMGQDSGKSPQDAASRTLKHLHEKRLVTLRN